jgi:hypothetical protein
MVLDSLDQEACSFQATLFPIFNELPMKLTEVESVRYSMDNPGISERRRRTFIPSPSTKTETKLSLAWNEGVRNRQLGIEDDEWPTCSRRIFSKFLISSLNEAISRL